MSTKEMTIQKKEVENQERTTPEKFYIPATDILEKEDQLILYMDMPGIRKENVNIQVEEGTLKVETSFDSERYNGLNPAYTEYNVGPFTRSFSLSTKIDQSKIQGKMDKGVLEITLPKKMEMIRQIGRASCRERV